MGIKYKNPPIVEVVCEFQFEPDTEWDIAMPGLIYEKVRDQFKNRKPAKVLSFDVNRDAEGIRQTLETSDRVQFITVDERALIQVGAHLLSVNHFAPYPTWEEFRPMIAKGLSAYREVAAPENVRRVGLRYLNHLEFEGARINLEEHFKFRPELGDELSHDIGPFIVGVQIPDNDWRDMLKIQLTSTRTPQDGHLAVSLDLDYYLQKPGAVPLNELSIWIEHAHSRIEDAFNACITEKTIQSLEPEDRS